MWKPVCVYGHEKTNDMKTAKTNQLPHTKTSCMTANACDEDMEIALAGQCGCDVASEHKETDRGEVCGIGVCVCTAVDKQNKQQMEGKVTEVSDNESEN